MTTDTPPIFLTGYMASGKTTLGKALARRLNRQFIDLDHYITQRFHTTIPEIFATRGEEEFRRIESAMLREIGEFANVVISCGGGTPCSGDNMDYMNSRGITLFLDASQQRILKRVRLKPGKRPLLDGMDEEELSKYIAKHLEQRMPHYSKAQYTIPSDRLESREEIAATVQYVIDIL